MTRSKYAIFAISTLAALALAGCGGGITTLQPTTGTGVEAVGSMIASRSRVAAGYEMGNPAYKDGFEVPSAMSISVAKMELLRGENDQHPYVVFDRGADLGDAKVINLTDGTSASFGENSDYPEAGTYTHIRLTLVYLDETVSMNLDGSGLAPLHIRIYASSVAPVVHGDVLLEANGELNWQKGGQFYPITGDRPEVGDWQTGRLVQFSAWAGQDSPDPYVTTLALPEGQSMIVPANPEGKFVVNVNFDATSSPQAPGANGIFFYDDINEDGVFAPGVSVEQGGDEAAPDSQFGEGSWDTLQPTITATFTKAD